MFIGTYIVPRIINNYLGRETALNLCTTIFSLLCGTYSILALVVFSMSILRFSVLSKWPFYEALKRRLKVKIITWNQEITYCFVSLTQFASHLEPL